MITAAQVADLQPGDVVEIASETWPEGTVVRGPLHVDRDGWLICADFTIRFEDGAPGGRQADTLTVVSRAPRPLYTNSDRTEHVPGDVVRSADDDDDVVYVYASPGSQCPWLLPVGDRDALLYMSRSVLPTRLRLLVDGEDGDIVLTVQS